MKILCKQRTGGGPLKPLQANQQVNRVGKYLYNNIEGAVKIDYTGNMCDVWFTLLYEVPPIDDPKYKRVDDELHELLININITTYQNKLRVNTIECTDKEKTLGFDLFEPEKLEDLESAKSLIMNKVYTRIVKAFKDYDFVGIEPSIRLNELVGRVGKYIYDNVESAVEGKRVKGGYNASLMLLYETPQPKDSRYARVDDELHEMMVTVELRVKDKNIQITTIEHNAYGVGDTIGSTLFNSTQLKNFETGAVMIIKEVQNQIFTKYKGYDFIF